MTRFPDGIGGKSFFQKDAPGFAPDWIRTERMWSEDTQREIDYFVCDDLASLLYVINLGSIPLHLWASRAPTLERPGLVRARSRSQGSAVHAGGRGGARGARPVRAHRAARLREDERLVGPAPARSARTPVHARAVALAGRAAGALPGRAAARDRHHHPTGLAAGRPGLHRLPAERVRQAARLAVLRAAAARVHRCPRRSPGARSIGSSISGGTRWSRFRNG